MTQQSAFRAVRVAADQASSVAATVNYQFLDTRRHEKDFLARKDDRYVKSLQNTAGSVHKSLGSLKAMSVMAGEALRLEVDNFLAEVRAA